MGSSDGDHQVVMEGGVTMGWLSTKDPAVLSIIPSFSSPNVLYVTLNTTFLLYGG